MAGPSIKQVTALHTDRTIRNNQKAVDAILRPVYMDPMIVQMCGFYGDTETKNWRKISSEK